MAARTLLEDFVLVTHAVPAPRVRPHLPAELDLETFRHQGRELAFVSSALFMNRHFRATAAPFPWLNFAQITYRTYVRHRGRRGVHFFATAVDSWAAFALQRSMSRIALHGRLQREKHVGGEGYEFYYFSLDCPALGETRIELQASARPRARAPFKTGDELAQFLTYRLHGFLPAPGGRLADQQVNHPRMKPLSGVLRNGRFEYWERLGILRPDETLAPYSVLIQPRVQFLAYPPVPVGWIEKIERRAPPQAA